MKDKKIETKIADLEYWMAKYKFVQEKFPGATVHDSYSPVTFSSKLVNPQYTKFIITQGYHTLFIETYLELEFEYNGKKEMINVYSSPRRNRLAQIVYPKDPNNPKQKFRYRNSKDRMIRFCKFKMNMNSRNLNDSCWHDCRAAIMKYIQDNPGLALDTKHLDPSLKKLMAFT